MAVNLSPLGGVAAQFFNNDGVPLSGGLIYTYTAGSSTPSATYTTGAGTIAHSNPIVLDSAGRVPGGEIWLLDGIAYKFVVKDSTGALIGTYDNIVGINSNFVNYTASQEIKTATAGQTLFTLTTMAYQPGTNSLSVFVDGVNQYGPGAQYAYTETSGTSVTFASGLHVGALVKFTTAVINNIGGVNASQVTYTPPFPNSVATNAQAKFAQMVSVKDFGAVGDGVADDFLAINRAAKYVADQGGGTVYYPPGTYRITRAIRLDDFNVDTNTYSGNVRRNMVHQGAGRDSTIIKTDGFYACAFTSFPEPFIPNSSISPAPVPGNVLCSNIVIKDMTLNGNKNVVGDGGALYGTYYQTSPQATGGWPNGYVGPSYWASDAYQFGIQLYYGENILIENCKIKDWWYSGILGYGAGRMEIHNNFIETCGNVATVLGYYAGLEFDQRTNTVSATDNVIQQCGNGVFSGTGAGATSPCTDIEISNNIFYGISPGNGIYARDYQSRWVVADNVFDSIGNQGIVFTNEQPGWPATDLPKDISITGNIIKEFNLLNGIGATGISALGHQFVIANNTIIQTNGAVTNPTFAIRTVDTIVTVSANERKGMIVTGNMISGKFPNNSAGVGMIYVDSENTLIANNQIMSNGSAAQTAITLYNTNSVVTGNNIVGSYIQTNRAIYRYTGATNMFIADNRYGPVTAFHTTAATGSISGTNNVDFSGLSTVVDIDNRGNYDSANDAFSPDIPGVYRLDAVLRITAASATNVQGLIEINNVTVISTGVETNGAGNTVTLTLSGFATLGSSDLVRLKANVTTGNYVIESYASLSAQFIRQTS